MPRNIEKTIRERIADVIPIENAETGDKSPTAQRMHELAKAAMVAGQQDANGQITQAWREYMTFLLRGLDPETPVDPDDLKRLVPDDGTVDDERQTERCYLLANGMCGTGTGENILNEGNPTFVLDRDVQ